MKLSNIITLISFLICSLLSAQKFETPPEGKSVVYFARVVSTGSLINFKYFDGNQYLGKYNARKYIRYECEPGKHLFWARSENVDFIEADLKEGAIYFIDVKPQIGLNKAQVKLVPINKDDDSTFFKRLEKLIDKKKTLTFNPKEFKEEAESLKPAIDRILERYESKIKKTNKVEYLKPDMNYPNL